jgi:hypothetical protein
MFGGRGMEAYNMACNDITFFHPATPLHRDLIPDFTAAILWLPNSELGLNNHDLLV